MHKISGFKSYKRSHSGDDSNEDPPVPIPNTEVKLVYARCSCLLRPQDKVVAGFQLRRVTVMVTLFSYGVNELCTLFYAP